MSTVSVACSIPQGFICELGLEMDFSLARFVRTPRYRAVKLNGSQHAPLLLVGGDTKRYLPQRNLPPGITQVDEDFIREWLRQHPKLAQFIWIIDSPKDLKHQVADRPEPPFEPLDRTKPMRFGPDTVETAVFSEQAKE
jgi:hypothetical protein